MPKIICKSTENITLGPQWDTCEGFEERGAIVRNRYDGLEYQIIAKRQHAFSCLKRSKKIFLGSTIVISTLGLALFCKRTRKLFTKNRKIVYFATLINENFQFDPAQIRAQNIFRRFGADALDHLSKLNPRISTEIVKLIAQQDGMVVSQYIESCNIRNEEALIEIAKLAAQQDGENTSFFIKNYKIKNQEALIEIAKLAAQQDGGYTSLSIKNYEIKNQEALIEIAKLAAQQDGGYTSLSIKNYEIKNQEALIEIAKLAAQQDGKKTSYYIKEYEITDKEALIDIAKLAIQSDGRGASKYIKKYEITDQGALIEIAKLVAQSDEWGISKYIKKYEITNQQSLMQIAYLAIKRAILNSSMSDFWEFLQNYNLSEEKLNKIRIFYACYYGIDRIENSCMQKFINVYIQSVQFPSFEVFTQKIAEVEKQISLEKDIYKLEKLQKKKQKALLYFSLVLEKSKNYGILLTENQQNYFIKAFEYRNQRESSLLMLSLIENFEKSNYFSNYNKLISFKNSNLVHLILPMIFINQWIVESNKGFLFNQLQILIDLSCLPIILIDQKFTDTLRFSSNTMQENVEQITSFLRGSKQRGSLRDAKGFLSNLLQALIDLSHLSTISSEQKTYFLNQCLWSALPIDREKEWEKRCKRVLNIVHILSVMGLLKPIFNQLSGLNFNYSFQEIVFFFNQSIQKIFLLDSISNDLYEKYLKVEDILRIPLAFVRYASNLRSIKESKVSQELKRLAIHVFEGSTKQERYRLENNPHLQKINKEFPKIFDAWQNLSVPIERQLKANNQQVIDFFIFLKEKILADKHFPQAPLSLRQFLGEQSHSGGIKKKTDEQITFLCKKLCDQTTDCSKKLDILKKLLLLIDQCEFKNDINSLYINLKTNKYQKNVIMVHSDDWQDLFLSGTEVLGSCQRIDGDPFLNVCLMAYVLDGKNKIFCIKDPITGKILARCISRLLFEKKQLVLFQEKIYPNPCEYIHLLNELAEIEAKNLGLELFTCNKQENLDKTRSYILESLESCSPYEYVDAIPAKTKGKFRIYNAKKVLLSGEKI